MFSFLCLLYCARSTSLLVSVLVQRNQHPVGRVAGLVSCCCCSVTESCLTLSKHSDGHAQGLPALHPLSELTQTHVHQVVMPSSHLVFCRPLLLLPSIFSRFRVVSNESVLCIRWPEYWTFSFSISPSNEYSGLISFRIDWFDLLAVQGTQESSLAAQFKSINSLVLSLLYGPTLTIIHDYGETIALTIWTFFSKMISLVFNALSRFIIAFLPRSKGRLTSWLKSPSALILEPRK